MSLEKHVFQRLMSLDRCTPYLFLKLSVFVQLVFFMLDVFGLRIMICSSKLLLQSKWLQKKRFA